MAILQHGKILNGVPIISNDILGEGKMIPGYKMSSVGYITVHNTGNWDVGAGNHHKLLKRTNIEGGRVASWHFCVDFEQIIQHVDTLMACFHAGNKEGNMTSIGIEVCQYNDKVKQKKAQDNAIALIHELIKVHKLSTSKVRKHQDWSGKYCPSTILDEGWDKFISRLTSHDPVVKREEFKDKTGYKERKGKVNTDNLNVRENRGTDYEVITKVNKGKIVDLGYNLNGWISIYFDGIEGFVSNKYIDII